MSSANYIETLTSFHKVGRQRIEWKEVLKQPAPFMSIRASGNEQLAIRKLVNYTPHYFTMLFGLQEKKIARLKEKVVLARAKDEKIFQEQRNKFRRIEKAWLETHEMSKGVLAKDIRAYQEVIDHFQPFTDITALGPTMNFEFLPDTISIDVLVNATEIIPREMTLSGEQYNELYQDFVCSCVLRIAREVLACIPVAVVVVNAVEKVAQTIPQTIQQTVSQTILSIAFSPDPLNRLDFDTIDPPESMVHFPHRMNWEKTTGFRPVERLSTQDRLLG